MESESDPLTREAVDLFEKELLKGKWEVNLHTPTKFGEDQSKDLGVHREQTNKRCSNGVYQGTAATNCCWAAGSSTAIARASTQLTVCGMLAL